MYSEKTKGFIINSHDYGDGHRIVIVFSEKFGKIKACAKGSRKINSKFGSALEPLTESQLMLYRKPGVVIYTITGCKSFKSYSKIRNDMQRFSYASIMAEGIKLLCPDEYPEEYIYKLFKQALDDICIKVPSATAWLFMFRLLKYSGYRLNMFECAMCRGYHLKNMFFSLKYGGVLCSDCLSDESVWRITEKTLRTIRMLSPGTVLDEDVEEDIGKVIKKYIKYQFDKDLRSLRFLKLFRETSKSC